jgi:dienelactone hydrolase
MKPAPALGTTPIPRAIRIALPVDHVEGILTIPEGATGIVLFAHGSGSSRHSARNRAVAAELQRGGLATLLMDLLTQEEDAVDQVTRQFRFNIALLTDRLLAAIDWVAQQPATSHLPIGLFGASTGAAAALRAAAVRPDLVRAVVSRGGRPDLAGPILRHVRAPTLLVVGANDLPVIPLNEDAWRELEGVAQLLLIPGASHLFTEPGALAAVTRHARTWFVAHLSAKPTNEAVRVARSSVGL